jgi:hypothetical protein
MLAIVLVAMPGAAAARPPTEARAPAAATHRFAATTTVAVTFRLAKHRTTGTLLRFGQNPISLVRSHGAVTLRAKGHRSHRIAVPAKSKRRIAVTLDAATGRAKLTVGHRSAAVRGRFVAERSISVRVRAVTALRISPGDPSRVAEPAPASAAPAGAGASGTGPTAGPAPAPSLFAPTSVWNAPLPDNAPLDPANATLVRTLQDTVAQNEAAGWGPWVSTSETSPLYTVPANQPTVRVTLDPGSWKVGLQQTFNAVPIPANAVPASGPDAHMTVWQPSTNRLWEFFKASKLSDGWHASFGGAMSNVSTSPGYYDTNSWPGLSQSYWGATATSLPVTAGTMTVSELRAGVIPHALAINIPWAKPNTYSWPAQRTDGRSTDPNAVPEGARFRIDPTLDIDKLNLPPMTRAMAKAAQRYGMIVRDQTGHAISFFAENPRGFATNPYVSPTGLYGANDPTAVMRAFPWDHVQLVKMALHTTS